MLHGLGAHVWLLSLLTPVYIYSQKNVLWVLLTYREFHTVGLGWWGPARFASFQHCAVTCCSKLLPGSLTKVADLTSFNKLILE